MDIDQRGTDTSQRREDVQPLAADPAPELAGEGEPLPDLHVGDRILVVVVQPEGQEGHAILSLRRARIERAWREIDEIYQRSGIVEAPVVEYNKGGLIVDVFG